MAGLSHAPFGVPCVRNNQGLELSRQKDVSDRYGETLIALLDRESVSLYEGTSFTGEESLIHANALFAWLTSPRSGSLPDLLNVTSGQQQPVQVTKSTSAARPLK